VGQADLVDHKELQVLKDPKELQVLKDQVVLVE
jgi:hypothetical protein